MISSVSSNRPATDYAQRQPVSPSNNAAPEVTLKPDAAKDKIGQLSENDLKVLSELKQRDAEVRAHEAAHLAAAGGLAKGGASFDYQQGPDGVGYAIGGEVNIDTSAVAGDPAATLRKADTIRRAAMSPAQPSGPDLQVAASATAMATQAQAELLKKNQDSQNGNKDRRGTQINLSA